MANPILEVTHLTTEFQVEAGVARAVDGISFHLEEGETLGLVGESGSGKSVTALSLIRLVPDPPGRIVSPSRILLKGQDLLDLPEREMARLRGSEIAMIFQDPMTALDPVFTIGNQLCEVLRRHRRLTPSQARACAVELLRRVGIPAPEERMGSYPHELSGGMRQRVMIAMALSCEPEILIADEPTTALDVTVQAQILALINDLEAQSGMATLLITHDLSVVAETCDRVLVMYAGRIVEEADVFALFAAPRHPYTRGLLDSIPRIDAPITGEDTELEAIPGIVPDIHSLPQGCRFADRCFRVTARCREADPPLEGIEEGRRVACFFPLEDPP